MENREENGALVAFTTLSPLPVGGLIGLLLLGETETGAVLEPRGLILLTLGLIALAASLLHLGRPLRAYRALQKLSTSWLSREVALYGLFILLLALYTLPVVGSPAAARSVAGPLGAIVGLLALIATGEVYHLRSRPAWEHRASTLSFPLSAFSAGLPVAITVAGIGRGVGTAEPIWTGWVATIASAALLAALLLTWFRAHRLLNGGGEERESWQMISKQYRWALLLRVGGLLCALAMMLSGFAVWLAWLPALSAEFADRVLFFNTAVPMSYPARAGVQLRPSERV
jgi:DMSO reductase anchor subunit